MAKVLRGGAIPVRDLGDTCVLAGRDDAPAVAGHFDTVPAQDNRPGGSTATASTGWAPRT